MDIADTLAPNSDQLDAVDLLGGPRTFTISKVSKGNAEQPVNLHLEEFDRPWRPGKSMRRVLVACWGSDAAQYVGRRVTLFCDPTVRFGGVDVGGTRISHLSHIDKPKRTPLLITRGKSAMFTVQPLADDRKQVSPGADTAPASKIQQIRKGFDSAGIPDADRAAFVASAAGRKVPALTQLTDDEATRVLQKFSKADPVQTAQDLLGAETVK